MKQELMEVLQELGYPVFLQGTLSEDTPYPSTFITYFNNFVDADSFYDDDERSFEWDFDVNVYSGDVMTTNETVLKIKKLLRSAGFIVIGKGHDIYSDEPSHTGRGINVKYKEV